MTIKLVIRNESLKSRAIMAVRDLPYDPPMEVVIRPYRQRRSLDQNAMMWSMLDQVSAQVDWHGRHMTAEEWKSVFTAALKKQDVVPNLDGDGFVVLGGSTSRMTVREMGDLIDLILAFGAERGLKFVEAV